MLYSVTFAYCCCCVLGCGSWDSRTEWALRSATCPAMGCSIGFLLFSTANHIGEQKALCSPMLTARYLDADAEGNANHQRRRQAGAACRGQSDMGWRWQTQSIRANIPTDKDTYARTYRNGDKARHHSRMLSSNSTAMIITAPARPRMFEVYGGSGWRKLGSKGLCDRFGVTSA